MFSFPSCNMWCNKTIYYWRSCYIKHIFSTPVWLKFVTLASWTCVRAFFHVPVSLATSIQNGWTKFLSSKAVKIFISLQSLFTSFRIIIFGYFNQNWIPVVMNSEYFNARFSSPWSYIIIQKVRFHRRTTGLVLQLYGSGNYIDYMEQFRLYRLSIDRSLGSPCKPNVLSVKLVSRCALTATGENLSNKLPN